LVYTGPGEHVFQLHWLLPDWEWKLDSRQLDYGIRLNSPHGWVTLHLSLDPRVSRDDVQLILVRAGSLVYGKYQPLPFEGWVSPTYGQKKPALSLTLEVSSLKSFTLISEFIFPQ
jgi:hypothetical protein